MWEPTFELSAALVLNFEALLYVAIAVPLIYSDVSSSLVLIAQCGTAEMRL